jgi:hypothetical protein
MMLSFASGAARLWILVAFWPLFGAAGGWIFGVNFYGSPADPQLMASGNHDKRQVSVDEDLSVQDVIYK